MPHHDPLAALALQLLFALGGPVVSAEPVPPATRSEEPAAGRPVRAGSGATLGSAVGSDPPAARAGPGPPGAQERAGRSAQ